MQIPAAMMIESAKDMVPKLDPAVRAKQQRELHVAVGEESPDFVRGYEIGLQTARVMLMTNPKAIQAGVSEVI